MVLLSKRHADNASTENHNLPNNEGGYLRSWNCWNYSCSNAQLQRPLENNLLIISQQVLTNNSISDFVVVEYNAEIGGRARSAQFGTDPKHGAPYTIELGPNWIEGVGPDDRPQNPIWLLAKKWNLQSHVSNKSRITVHNETGAIDASVLLEGFYQSYNSLSSLAGGILLGNLPDQSARAGLSLVSWQPGHDMAAHAVEWWSWDWESAQSPDVSSLIFGIAQSNLTFNYFGVQSSFVKDRRGYNSIIKSEASTFLNDVESDPRILLSTIVEEIEHSDNGVTIHNRDGSCIRATYGICTFALGVLQKGSVRFSPPLPNWKKTAIAMFRMGTYMKIFFQFATKFWPNDVEYFLYADPTRRGYFPVWQSLSLDGFYPNSNIIFVTVVGNEAFRIEAQSDHETQNEAIGVLKKMFPDKTVPEPMDFLFPRWGSEPWSFGSYSDCPLGASLEMHQNLRANVGNLFSAGEAMCTQYMGLMHGAWFEGREVGHRVARLLTGDCEVENDAICGSEAHYEDLRGVTPFHQYNSQNVWVRSSFEKFSSQDVWMPRP